MFEHKPSVWKPSGMVFLTAEPKGLYLMTTYKFTDMLPRLSKSDALLQMSANDLVQWHGGSVAPGENLAFNDDLLPIIEEKIQKRIMIYELDENERIDRSTAVVRGRFARQYADKVHLVINSRDLMNNGDARFSYVANDKIFGTYYRCMNCAYSATHNATYVRHTNRQIPCNADGPNIRSVQRALGNPETMIEKCIRLGFLPESLKAFRQKYLTCFDIECLEQKLDTSTVYGNTTQEAKHNLVSLALASNIPGATDKFFVRESSAPEMEQLLIKKFVDEYFLVYLSKYLLINVILCVYAFEYIF